MKKKIVLSFMLVCISIFAFAALTVSAETYGNLTYEINNGEVTITDCNTSATNVVIPASINDYPVTSIGNYAFSNCSSLTSITIPDGVTSIGSGAFNSCSRLTSITIPDGVTIIDDDAFCNCYSLTSITIPDSVTSIGNEAFYYCSKLTSITIPDGVTSIGDQAFRHCIRLTNIKVDENNAYFCSLNGNLYNKDQTMLIQYAIGKSDSSFVIPDSVTSIGNYALSGCSSLTSITIPNGVTSIGSGVFYGTAYYNNDSNWENDVLYIGHHLIKAKSSLSGEYTVKHGTKTIANEAFNSCSSLTSITIPNGVTNIGYLAFRECSSLTSIEVDENNAYFCSLNGNLYNKDQTMLIQYAVGKSDSSFVIPDSVTRIGNYAFSGCSSLTSITISNGVTNIGDNVFFSCSSLTSITIPDGVTNIGNYAFCNCSKLTSITIPDSVTNIGNYAFYKCSSLTSITIPNGVTNIGNYAFYNCLSLTNITIPDSVTSIGNYAFCDCYGLTSITIPNSVTSIGDDAFYNCHSLTNITIPDSVTSVGNYAFSYCSKLTSITMPDCVTNVGNYAFSHCSSLTTVYYNGTEQTWNKINIGASNDYLKNAERKYFWYVTLIGENGQKISRKKYDIGSVINLSDNEKDFYSIHLYTDEACQNEFDKAAPITENLTLQLRYIINQYTYKFIDEDGTVLKEGTVDYGTTITPPENPTKASTPKYTYAFAGWDGFHDGITQINEEMVFTAKYSATINQYTCKFIDEDGTVLKEETVDYGTTITPPENPTKASTPKYTYTFADWDGFHDGITQTNKEMVFTAKYNATINQYTYKFIDENGTILKEETVDYGTIITPPENPTKASTPKYTYTFAGWNGFYDGITQINEEMVFTAKYSATINQYTCKFIDEDGTVLSEELIDYGAVIVPPENPTKASTPKYTYTFAGWDGFHDGITQTNKEMVFTAKYSATINQYTYKFIDEDGTVLKEATVDYGTTITPPENPSKASTPKYTYTFAGWNGFYDGITQINEEMVFTAKYNATINQYTYKFIDEDGTILSEGLIDYGAVIVPPENPTKASTPKYTYTFAGWDGFHDGITQINEEMVFTAKYNATINQYTCKFIDEDGTVLKEETVDYGTVIELPETPADKDPYTFDYWQNYIDGMTLTGDMEFTAVYKYKTYTITAKDLEKTVKVVYNDAFEIEPYTPGAEYSFVGYFTEENGKGTKVTDENGKSIEIYNFTNDITLYPYFPHKLLNKIKIGGADSTGVGNSDVVKHVYFATDKEAYYLICNIKYPEDISLREILPKDFKYVSEESREIIDGAVYLSLICQYTNDLDALPINKKIEPFELVFDIPENVAPQSVTVEITSESVLYGEADYTFDDIINGDPIMVESITIVGDDKVAVEDGDAAYTAEITPYYAANKEVVWSVDNEETAVISQDGVLTPLRSGKVIITAAAKDGSGVFAVKEINIMPLAKIISLKSNIGQWDKEFDSAVREYTVYVPNGTEELSLTADFTSGTLKVSNGTTTATMMKNRAQSVKLTDDKTNVILLMGNQTDCVDSEYKITVIKYEGTKTAVSDDGKKFDITPVNIEKGKEIILALYDGDKLVEMQSKAYDTEISFTTDKTYTAAKVMVWESLINAKPVCDVEAVK